MNAILACLWLILGVTLIAWPRLTGNPGLNISLFGTPVSLGWVALFLAVYNVIRAALVRRERPGRAEQRPAPPSPPDPNFLFTDRPPDRPPGDRPV